MPYLDPKKAHLDPDVYPEELRRKFFPKLYPPPQNPNPSEANPPTVAAAAVQPSTGATRVVDGVANVITSAGVTARTGAATENDFFTPLANEDVPSQYQVTLAKYRALATDWGVPTTTSLCYRVRAGFTLKRDAPKLGPCYNDFQYLQDWNFPDEPTQDCYVFWIPFIVPGGMGKNVAEQLQLLAELRSQHGLPSHHLTSFGSGALVAGLTLAHYKATGKRAPEDCRWVRTDTCNAGSSRRLGLSWFGGALYCDYWYWVGERDVSVGGFALGVELGS